MFRRRRREEAAEPEVIEDEVSEDPGLEDEETWDEPGDAGSWDDEEDGEAAVPAGAGEPAWGPWDAADEIPPLNRVDFGSLQVPVVDGFEIQLNIADDQGPLIAVVQGDSSLQVQAFAAPKTDGLWEDVRQEIAAAVAQAGGEAEEADGPFGPELRARVPGEQPQLGLQPIRFLGVDGPRWFLRGVITGPAAEQPAAAAGSRRSSPAWSWSVVTTRCRPATSWRSPSPRRPARPWRSRWPRPGRTSGSPSR